MGPVARRTRPARVLLHSDPDLAADVQTEAAYLSGIKPHFGTWKPVTAVPGLRPLQIIGVHPGDILRELSLVTTPPHMRWRDFFSASQWAWVRYRWAFDRDPVNRLVVSGDALRLVDHHATVFSEHVGVAFGLEVARQVLLSSYPGAAVTFHDVDFVLNGQDLRSVGFVSTSRRRPDYIARIVLGGLARYYVIECKGRRDASRSKLTKQFATGTAQVHALRAGGRVLPSLILGTVAGHSGISVHALDPDEEPPSFPVEDQLRPVPAPLSEFEDVVDLDPQVLGMRMETVAVAQPLLNAGLFGEAADVLREDVGRADAPDIVRRDIEGVPHVGRETTLPIGDGRVTFFSGVDAEAIDRARRGSSRPVERLLAGNSRGLTSDPGVDDVDTVGAQGWEASAPDDSGYRIASWPVG